MFDGAKEKETYLGDGLYVSWNHGMIILRAPRTGGDHYVAMEPRVIQAFNNFLEALLETRRKAREELHDQDL
jgi:hypothetical protein